MQLNRVPPIAHFIWLSRDPRVEFRASWALAMISAYEVQSHIDVFRLHTNCEFYGKYWDMVTDKLGSKLHIVHVDNFDEILGNKVVRLCHKSDWIRFNFMYETGGYYFDLDAISLKSLEVFSQIGRPTLCNEVGCNPDEPEELGKEVGLSNGLMIAPPGCEWYKLVMEGYKDFHYADGHNWAIRKPLQLYYSRPDLVNVVHQEFFNYPLYYLPHLKMIFESRDLELSRAYVLHLWESQADKAGYGELMDGNKDAWIFDSIYTDLLQKYNIW